MGHSIKQRVLSNALLSHVNQTILVSGWLYKKRLLGNLAFVILRDRRGLIQVVVEQASELEKLKGMQSGSILSIEGKVREQASAPGGAEIYDPLITIDVLVIYPSPIEIDKPIDHTPDNLDTLFEWRMLNIRNVVEQGIWRIQSGISTAIRHYLTSHEFVEFHSPKLLAGTTEGGAEVFKVNYFGKQATLAQSAQFYKQIMVGAFERVFEFGSTYRAEPSVTTRHMSEFITVDVEIGFIAGMDDVMRLLNELIRAASDAVWKSHARELDSLKAARPLLPEQFPSITLTELHELCYRETGYDFRQEKDPSPFQERWICEYSARVWSSDAVFITGFPASDMKFYHYRSDENPSVADRFDLIFRGVEIATGSRREHRYLRLIDQLKALGADPESLAYHYYLQAFKHGMPTHGGFGLGLERLTQMLIGLRNVKEATLFPRDTRRLAP